MPGQQGGDDDKDLGLDWLAAQLNADGSSKSADEADSEGAADARPDSAPTVALPVAPAAVPPAPRPADPPVAPPAAAASGDSAPVEAAPAPASSGFRWGLTPSIEPDPAVDTARRTPPSAKAAPTAPPTPAAAPPTPAAAPPTPAAAPPVAAVTPAAAPPVVPAAPAPVSAPEAASPPPAVPPVAPTRPAAPAPVTDTQPAQPLTKTPAPPRRSPADLEAAPWWTTPAQSRLVPTAEEEAAAQGRRTPAAPPSPLDTGVAPRTVAAATPPVASTPPASHRAAHPTPPAAEEPPTALPVSAATAAAATGAVAPAPAKDAHAAPAPTADEPGPRRRGPADATPPRGPSKRTLYWAGGAVLAVLVIIGLFFLGQNLGGTPVAAPTESASAEPSAAPTPTTAPEPAASGPLAAGVHAWDTMFGTECLEPYTSPWDEEFTVVDCATPHTAQLVYRGILPGDSGSPFPGEQAFADQINVLCSAPGVIDFEAAGAYADVQLQGSYPVTAEQWDAGDRYFYCFASRASGEPLTTSLAPAA